MEWWWGCLNKYKEIIIDLLVSFSFFFFLFFFFFFFAFCIFLVCSFSFLFCWNLPSFFSLPSHFFFLFFFFPIGTIIEKVLNHQQKEESLADKIEGLFSFHIFGLSFCCIIPLSFFTSPFSKYSLFLSKKTNKKQKTETNTPKEIQVEMKDPSPSPSSPV